MNFSDFLHCFFHALGSTMFPSKNSALLGRAFWGLARALLGNHLQALKTEGGTIYHTRPRQRSVQMKETWLLSSKWSSKKRYANRKKQGVARDFLFAWIGKDIQKDFTKIYKIFEFCLRFFFFRLLFPEKGIIGRIYPSTLKLES